jgi:hypothetical protein
MMRRGWITIMNESADTLLPVLPFPISFTRIIINPMEADTVNGLRHCRRVVLNKTG